MNYKPNGGPAFPLKREPEDREQLGMTLRDYFAGQVIASWGEVNWNDSHQQREAIAITAYGIADAMLQERAK